VSKPANSEPVHVVGGGLAGTECAYQLARRGVAVVLYEMRPQRSTPAHKTGDLAELVCSNSLRSDDPFHAAGLLKREMERFDSLIIASARAAAVPAGNALAVDRDRFAERVTGALDSLPGLEIRRHEVREIPPGDVVLATGPLTSPAMAEQLQEILGEEYLYFYDSIAPIVDGSSLDFEPLFWQSRWGKGGDDYLNVPLDREGYLAFHRLLVEAEVQPLHDFEEALFFEGCLPIEEIARRGVDTPRFGPMKSIGLEAPDGTRPYAVVQLRRESLAHDQFNIVGFQSRLKWPEQKRVFGTLPGFAQVRFLRLGQVHRNTFINAPTHLDRHYRLHSHPRIRLAGQITGVEGYLESAATGLAIGLYLSHERKRREDTGQDLGDPMLEPFPPTTAFGAMARHLTASSAKNFQPANINYGLFEDLGTRIPRKLRRGAYAERAWVALTDWADTAGLRLEEIAGLPAEPVRA
jgi:methylenetetrahydrofolate--tRNA-(uracil-5-)-methyltransferase